MKGAFWDPESPAMPPSTTRSGSAVMGGTQNSQPTSARGTGPMFPRVSSAGLFSDGGSPQRREGSSRFPNATFDSAGTGMKQNSSYSAIDQVESANSSVRRDPWEEDATPPPAVEYSEKQEKKISNRGLEDGNAFGDQYGNHPDTCLLYTSPSPRDRTRSRMPSSA